MFSTVVTIFLKDGTRLKYLIKEDPNTVKSAIQSIYGDFVNIKVEGVKKSDLYTFLANLHVFKQKNQI